jgi:hypothetical protein
VTAEICGSRVPFFVCASGRIPTSRRRSETWGTHVFLDGGDGILQAGAIASGVTGAGWAVGARLAVGQIAAQDRESGGAEGIGQSDEQWGLRV